MTGEKDLNAHDAVATYTELTDVERGFRQLKDVMGMRPIFHQVEHRVKAYIFVAALALLVQRLLGKQLREAKVDLSPARAIQALLTVRLVTFRLNSQGEPQGIASSCPNARLVLSALKLIDRHSATPPDDEKTVL